MQPINLKGEKYLLKGLISVDSNENFPDSIPLDILDNQETLVDNTVAERLSSEVDQSGAAVYEYSFWANLGEKLIFVPRDPRYVCFYFWKFLVTRREIMLHIILVSYPFTLYSDSAFSLIHLSLVFFDYLLVELFKTRK